MELNIRYGSDSINKHFDGDSVRISDVLRNSAVKMALGYSDNVKALQDGVELGPDSTVSDGDSLVIETRANSKAVSRGELLDIADNIQNVAKIMGDLATRIITTYKK